MGGVQVFHRETDTGVPACSLQVSRDSETRARRVELRITEL